MSLALFADVTIDAVFDRFDANDTGVTWVGHVDNRPLSTVTLVMGGGLMAGTIVMPGGVYSIRPAPDDVRQANAALGALHVVTEVNQSRFAPELPPIPVRISPADAAAAADVPLRDTADFVDVMVLYTPLAASSNGGVTGITNLINLGISETNTSYANSGVHHRLRLAHAAQVNYTETPDFAAALTALRLGQGAFSGVPGLRDSTRADLVKLLINPNEPSGFCGIGYLMTTLSTAFAPFGFSVTDTTCVSPNYTFAHELGHNMGAAHDWFISDAGGTPFSYAHGYVNVPQRMRTVMAYADHCGALGLNCTRLLLWSNPSVRVNPPCGRGMNCAAAAFWYYPGARMGVQEGTSTACIAGRTSNPECDADDVRMLNNTAPSVANFRQQ